MQLMINTNSDFFLGVTQEPVAEGGPGGAVPPQQEIKLNSCPTKPKCALADFNHIYRSYK